MAGQSKGRQRADIYLLCLYMLVCFVVCLFGCLFAVCFCFHRLSRTEYITN